MTAKNSATPSAAAASLAVGMCTFKRLPSLLRTLEHVSVAAKQFPQPIRVIVVDNDGNDAAVGEAVAAFAQSSGLPVDYIVESTPGISAARNAVFAQADSMGVRFLATIDDDEWPSPQWLVELVRAQAGTDAAVVGGPVRPVFPDSAAHLRKYERYWSVQRQFLNGKPFVFCSCNFLIDLHAIANEPRPLFDDAFGLSGGGDTVFFRKLFFNGHPMAWTEDAWLYEEVPASRASLKWMRQRRYRVGNHAVRWESMGGKLKSFAKTLGLTLRLLVYPAMRREPESPWLGWLLEFDKVRGRYASHLGSTFMEYARPQAPGDKACQ